MGTNTTRLGLYKPSASEDFSVSHANGNMDIIDDKCFSTEYAPEAYLSWGGRNVSGGVTPVGASLSSEHSANRLAYLNPNALTFEYSDNGGSSWTAMSIANSTKIGFVTTSGNFSVGNASTVTTNHRSRVTLTAQNGTTGYVYTRPRKLLLNVSTNGHGLQVTLEIKTGVSGASWTTVGTYALSGWSGWNDIPLSFSTLGGGTTQTGNIWYMRLTFATTSVNSSYTTSKSTIIGMRLFGDTCWTRTSNMGETGHLYSYDTEQNATFPAKLSATQMVIGHGLTAKSYNSLVGMYNNTSTTTAISNINSSTDTGTVFAVGCGTSSTGKNALRITKAGLLYGSSSITTSGADYAEYFEWADGNPNNEDRVGRLVTMDGMYIRLAQPGEWVLGIVSAAPCFLGDGQEEEWQGMYIKDVYGRKMIIDGEHVLNPDYDPTMEFKGREIRPEWSPVGLVGKLVVDDDGTAEVNGFITTGKDGIATASKTETRFRVIERLDDHHIKVVKI